MCQLQDPLRDHLVVELVTCSPYLPPGILQSSMLNFPGWQCIGKQEYLRWNDIHSGTRCDILLYQPAQKFLDVRWSMEFCLSVVSWFCKKSSWEKNTFSATRKYSNCLNSLCAFSRKYQIKNISDNIYPKWYSKSEGLHISVPLSKNSNIRGYDSHFATFNSFIWLLQKCMDFGKTQ